MTKPNTTPNTRRRASAVLLAGLVLAVSCRADRPHTPSQPDAATTEVLEDIDSDPSDTASLADADLVDAVVEDSVCGSEASPLCMAWYPSEAVSPEFRELSTERAETRLEAIQEDASSANLPELLTSVAFPDLTWGGSTFIGIDVRLTSRHILLRGEDATVAFTNHGNECFPDCDWYAFAQPAPRGFACYDEECVLASNTGFEFNDDETMLDEACRCRQTLLNVQRREFTHRANVSRCDQRPSFSMRDGSATITRAIREEGRNRIFRILESSTDGSCASVAGVHDISMWSNDSPDISESSTLVVGEVVITTLQGGFVSVSEAGTVGVEWLDNTATSAGPGLAWWADGELHVFGPDGVYTGDGRSFERLESDDMEYQYYSGEGTIDEERRVWTALVDQLAPSVEYVSVAVTDGRTTTSRAPALGMVIYGPPTVTTGGLIFHGSQGLVLVDAQTLEPVWRLVGTPVPERAAIDDEGRMFVRDHEGVLSIWQTDLALADTPCPVPGCDFGYSNRVRDVW